MIKIRLVSDVKLNAEAKRNGVVAYKISDMTVRKGIDYKNQKCVKEKVAAGKTLTHELPFGEWAKNPKQYPDSIYQKKLSDLKAGNLKDGKIPTLTIVIKPTDNASYKNMVDALDEMQILNIGTYVIDKISADDEKLLKSRNVKM